MNVLYENWELSYNLQGYQLWKDYKHSDYWEYNEVLINYTMNWGCNPELMLTFFYDY